MCAHHETAPRAHKTNQNMKNNKKTAFTDIVQMRRDRHVQQKQGINVHQQGLWNAGSSNKQKAHLHDTVLSVQR